MIKTITTEEVKENLDNKKDFLLVDTLSKNSFEGKHVPGAKNIPYSPTFLKDFEEAVTIPKDTEIVVYCASSGCQLSVMSADVLNEAGYTNVSHFKDGLAGWMQAGYELEGAAV